MILSFLQNFHHTALHSYDHSLAFITPPLKMPLNRYFAGEEYDFFIDNNYIYSVFVITMLCVSDLKRISMTTEV